MGKIYEAIKKIGKKVIVPAMVAGSLYLGSSAYSQDLPIKPEVKASITQEMSKQKQEYLGKIEEKFNQAIRDRNYTVEEQKQMLADFDSLKSKQPSAKIPAKYEKLYNLINENINGFDSGTPSLEKKLVSQGLDVKVEKNKSDIESAFAFVGILVSIGFGTAITYELLSRHDKEEK